MALTLHPLGETGAAEIVGLDGSRALEPATVAALKEAFVRYPILALRDQYLEPRAQAAFSRHFGALEEQINTAHVHPDDPYVLILSNEIRPDGTAVGIVDAGDFLHSDSSWSPEPVQTTILQAVRNPSRGGDTEYCNMYQVHDAIPPELMRRIAGRSAVHHVSKSKNPRVAISAGRPGAKEFYEKQAQERPEVAHPIVRTHPESGRQALYISPRFTLAIEGLEPAESDEILDALFALMREPRFRYVHKWKDGDLVMWDNRCLTHRATGGYVLPDIRRMHRTTISGDRPFYTPTR